MWATLFIKRGCAYGLKAKAYAEELNMLVQIKDASLSPRQDIEFPQFWIKQECLSFHEFARKHPL